MENSVAKTCSVPPVLLCSLSSSSIDANANVSKPPPPSTPSPPAINNKTYAKETNLVHRIRLGQTQPDKQLFVHVGASTHSTKSYTQAQFWNLVGKYAALFRRLGLNKGDRVAAQVSKRIENVALYLGCVQMGGIYLPMNVDYTLDELQYFVQDAQPSIYVHQAKSKVHHKLLGGCSSCCWLSEEQMFERAEGEQPETHMEQVHVDDVAAILYTSGTTGKPKGAQLTHGNLVSNAETLSDMWQMQETDTMLHCLPIFHVHGLFVALHPLLLVGAKILFLRRFDIDTVIEQLPRATVMMGVPTYYTRLMQSPAFNKSVVQHMRLFTSGSAPLLECTWNKFRDVTGGQEILERYGMTEGQMVCSNPFNGPRKPTTVGPPLPGIEARVRNGILEYRGPNVFLGYWNKPEKTQQEFTSDGFFKSGDLAHIDDDGYVHILGRGKDLIISGGLNVYPKEVENILDRIPGIKESAVVGLPDPDFGEAVVAVVVPYGDLASPSGLMPSPIPSPISNGVGSPSRRQPSPPTSFASPPGSLPSPSPTGVLTSPPGGLALTPAQIISECRTQLARYKVPKQVHFMDCLPRNTMGKVQKNKIREMLIGEQPLSCGYNVTYDQ